MPILILSNSRLFLRLRVDFALPLSQEEQQEQQEEQEPLTKIYQKAEC